jgi:hypothetical protein
MAPGTIPKASGLAQVMMTKQQHIKNKGDDAA